jgi:hypothetical protein
MDFSRITIRHGKLTTLQGSFPGGELRAWRGTPKTWSGITMVAASVRLGGRSFTRSRNLSEHLEKLSVPPEVRPLLLNGYDGPWVRGRIERVFRVALPTEAERGEKSGLHGEFLAVVTEQDGTLVGVPFWCNDYYLKTGLIFSEQEDPPPKEVADRIAAAFWSLLLSEPNDLPEYRDRMFHLGAGIWLVFGVQGNQPFIEEHDDEPDAGANG